MAKAETVVIKKYGNRRLYDTTTSRYIKLEEVAGMVRKGKQVRVVDARTGQDLTRVTLTQIIVEDAKGGPSGLPLELLRQLIVASDQAGREFVMWYLNSAFDAYRKVQSSLTSGLQEVRSVVMPPLEAVQSSIVGRSTQKPSRKPSPARAKKPARPRPPRRAKR